jgi:phosphomannomutase / phosphoglucomutase
MSKLPKVNRNIFRAYDIRGIAHTPNPEKGPGGKPDLTPETIHLIGHASGTYIKRKYGTNLVVGHDCRLSNPELSNAFIEGLRKSGCSVTLIGMTPTPMLYFAVCEMGFDGGAAITASHNPKEYNGVKLVASGAHSICGDELQEVYDLIESGDLETTNQPGELKELDVFPAYLEKLDEVINIPATPNDKPLKVAVDSGNGATGPFVRPFLEALGCEVIELFTKPDGSFPNHPANPEELENMQDLIAAVAEHGADLGLGFDGDGDRVGVVDEKGNHYSADLLLLLLARDLLSRQPGAQIVFDVKVSKVLIDDITAHGGTPVMEKTGHSFIESKMREIGAPLGGEISGHMFFAENYYGFDDAFLAAGKLLEILAKAKINNVDSSAFGFSNLFADVAKTACTPELKSSCPDDKKFAIVDQITHNLSQEYDCITIDGIRVNFDENSWGAVRCSNTSPNLTIRFEAPTQQRLDEITAIMLEELRKYPEIDLWWAK